MGVVTGLLGETRRGQRDIDDLRIVQTPCSSFTIAGVGGIIMGSYYRIPQLLLQPDEAVDEGIEAARSNTEKSSRSPNNDAFGVVQCNYTASWPTQSLTYTMRAQSAFPSSATLPSP